MSVLIHARQFRRRRVVEKIFITAHKMATFICPACRRTKTVDVTKNKTLARAVKVRVKCPCGHVYSVQLERRRHYRKETDLPGAFFRLKSGKKIGHGSMVVKDISRSGLRCKLNSRINLKVGDTILVEFHLDDRQRSHIKKEAVVRIITNNEIGVEFSSMDPSDISDKRLGFYLFG